MSPEDRIAELSALMDAGVLAEADAGFVALLEQYPRNVTIMTRYARVAERRADWTEAVQRWRQALAKSPANRVLLMGLAAALVRDGKAEAADRVLSDALAPLAGGLDLAATDASLRRLMVEHARLATVRLDVAAARQRWQALLAQLPRDQEVLAGWQEACGLDNDTEMEPAAVGAAARPEVALVSRFESLGGNCEFGLVQRHFGAEPLGLMRWLSISPERLCEALETKLAGIGEAQFTELRVGGGHEFITSDTRYGMAMHTFIKDSGQDKTKLAVQMQRRLRFLRDKLLQDLAAGEKIFLYRCREDTTNEHVEAMSACVRSYNQRNRLLAVFLTADDGPPVAVRRYKPRMLSAAIRNGRKRPFGSGWNIDFDAWMQILRQTLVVIAPKGQK
jgi:tetratricopeptide (TPR) repeat protein